MSLIKLNTLFRSGQGKVYQLINRRRFQQMEVKSFKQCFLVKINDIGILKVLEGQNILVTISGKKNRVRVYYLSWLKSKILK